MEIIEKCWQLISTCLLLAIQLQLQVHLPNLSEPLEEFQISGYEIVCNRMSVFHSVSVLFSEVLLALNGGSTFESL